MTFAGKPLDRCRIHTVPCPYGGQEAPCQRCNGDGASRRTAMGRVPSRVPCLPRPWDIGPDIPGMAAAAAVDTTGVMDGKVCSTGAPRG